MTHQGFGGVGRPAASVLTALLLTLGGLSWSSASRASEIEFVVDVADGAVFIRNTATTVLVFDGYSITSPTASLDIGSWTRITGSYDLSGDESVDSSASWFVLGATAANVAEASPDEGSASLAPGQVVSLGHLYDGGFPGSLSITTSANGVVSDPFAAAFRDLTADYDADLDVDQDDYGVFEATYDSTMDLRADGNGDGVVNAADYTVWRDSPSLTLAPAVSPAALRTAGLAIPEPAAGWLAGLAVWGVNLRRRRRA